MFKSLLKTLIVLAVPTVVQWGKQKLETALDKAVERAKLTPTKVDDNILATVEQAVALIHASGGNAEVIIRGHRKGEPIDSPAPDA